MVPLQTCPTEKRRRVRKGAARRLRRQPFGKDQGSAGQPVIGQPLARWFPPDIFPGEIEDGCVRRRGRQARSNGWAARSCHVRGALCALSSKGFHSKAAVTLGTRSRPLLPISRRRVHAFRMNLNHSVGCEIARFMPGCSSALGVCIQGALSPVTACRTCGSKSASGVFEIARYAAAGGAASAGRRLSYCQSGL